MKLPELARWQRQWRAALAVRRAGSAAQSAQSLHASPSAVGRAIQALEAALQRNLFERRAQGMTVSADGAMLLPRIARVFSQYERADQELSAARGGQRGS